MSIEIKKVAGKSDKQKFIDFPHELYKNDANYVPELYIAMDELMDEKKNPFFKHSSVELYLAYKNDQIVGRIAAVNNTSYNAFHQSNVGFFGFFDCIDDQQVASLLIEKAENYARSFGYTAVLGPVNFSTNDTAGLLINGFDSPPVIQMTYNFPYYAQLLENCGYQKEMDLFAYWLDTNKVSQKSLQLTDKIQERLASKGITFRNLNMKNFKQEVESVKQIYRSAWESNWGFFPPTDEEFDFLAQGLKFVLNPKYAYIAEENGKMIGFAVGLPNLNEILINVKKGRLFPFGIFKILMGKSKVKKVRVLLLGVKKEYRRSGIEAVFYSNFIKAAQMNGLEGGEASWILESNEMMVKGAENLNGERYKTYRIYSKKI